MTVAMGDFPLTGDDLAVDGVAFAYGPRRTVLDRALVDAAVEAGAELRDDTTVQDYLFDDGRVSGIRARTGAGGGVTERARITIGADGRHSLLAAKVDAPIYDAAPTATCWYFSYWSGVGETALQVHDLGDRVIFAFPTTDKLFAVFVAWPIAALSEVRLDIEAHVHAALDRVPRFGEAVRAGRREERFRGATDLPNFFRKPFGPGWALVGDASAHKDPYLALGICDGFRDAELLADAVDEGLSGKQAIETALAGYERRRNEAAKEDYWQNLSAARFEPPPPQVFQLRAALRDDPSAARQFFLAREHMIPREAFFNPDNLQRLLARTAAT